MFYHYVCIIIIIITILITCYDRYLQLVLHIIIIIIIIMIIISSSSSSSTCCLPSQGSDTAPATPARSGSDPRYSAPFVSSRTQGGRSTVRYLRASCYSIRRPILQKNPET